MRTIFVIPVLIGFFILGWILAPFVSGILYPPIRPDGLSWSIIVR